MVGFAGVGGTAGLLGTLEHTDRPDLMEFVFGWGAIGSFAGGAMLAWWWGAKWSLLMGGLSMAIRRTISMRGCKKPCVNARLWKPRHSERWIGH